MGFCQDESCTSTPPHHPTYQVHASTQDILQILNHAIPHAKLLSNVPIPHGQSYNNRIYTLSLSIPGAAGSEASVKALILKVGGRFWKSIKTLNEVMCLKLVKLHCPEMPIPEVVAWSNRSGEIAGIDFEWILMTHLPGTDFQPDQLTTDDREAVAADLARYLSVLRKMVPSPGEIGNVVDIDANGSAQLGGLVDAPGARGWPYGSYLDYKQSVMTYHVELLEQSEELRPNRYLIPTLRHFLQSTLPDLAIFQDPRLSFPVFTHYDLSGRNILVSRRNSPPPSHLSISGILDWEFSGFFSPLDEYLLADDCIFSSANEQRCEGGGGTNPFADRLLAKLEESGVSTPRTGFVKEHWQVAVLLNRLTECVAPWWLRGMRGKELEKGLAEAAGLVEGLMEELAVEGAGSMPKGGI